MDDDNSRKLNVRMVADQPIICLPRWNNSPAVAAVIIAAAAAAASSMLTILTALIARAQSGPMNVAVAAMTAGSCHHLKVR